jgi:PPOX class probable F420-dependent enzyme
LIPLSQDVERKLRESRSAHLATTDALGQPHLVPICFAFDGVSLYTPIDHKPKTGNWRQLTRVRNIQANPQVAFLIDQYSEQWTDLWYVQIRGVAELLTEPVSLERQRALQLLRDKYEQYRGDLLDAAAPIIRLTPQDVRGWGYSS